MKGLSLFQLNVAFEFLNISTFISNIIFSRVLNVQECQGIWEPSLLRSEESLRIDKIFVCEAV